MWCLSSSPTGGSSGSSRFGGPRGGGGTPPSGRSPGVYYADLTLGGQMITVKLLVQEYKSDSGTHVKYLYTTDLSLSEEEIEEVWRMRWEIEELHRDVKALGLEDSSFWRGFRVTSRSSPS
jgi:Archaeal putative transposase ISC1217.